MCNRASFSGKGRDSLLSMMGTVVWIGGMIASRFVASRFKDSGMAQMMMYDVARSPQANSYGSQRLIFINTFAKGGAIKVTR